MAELKTKENDASVHDFIESITDEIKKTDSFFLLELFEEITGEPAKMWGKSIVGFGSYHYKSERSSQEGDWMLTGFSPRKAQISLYIMPGINNYANLLKDLGKYKLSTGSCLYIKKLADVDLSVLKKIIKAGYEDMKESTNS